MTPAVERLRATVTCFVITAVVFAQDAGRQVTDTKLDLRVDPGGLLTRALHLWEPLGGAGQLQNQGYGYLFPMGPFFWLLDVAGLPPWVVQRAWQSLVLCVAFLGVRALATRLGIGSPGTRLLAGVAYAFAARPVSQVGAISIEVWPFALAPWVLVPLVTGAQRGSPRRAAALSGLAVLLVGGVNAAATLAVVPLGALWLATCAPGPRRRRLAGWWAVSVGCATAWWLGPLLLLGRYSPPFLDVIESASTTTHETGLWPVLTGNDLWLQYLSLGRPDRPAGHLLVTEPALVVCVTALWALGLVGLLLRRTPHRGFLAGGVLLGALVVTAGHTGALTGPLAGWERDLLDAALAPFRNVHKYDLLLRLPLALGLAAAADAVRLPSSRLAPRPVALLALLAVAGAASPALGRLEPAGSYRALPGYWRQAADWLAHAEPGRAAPRAMVVPAAPFGEYAWGSTSDEPLQALARSPWVVRDAVPLGGPGSTRVLDTVEEVLRSGRGSPALAAYLARAGVRYLLVRNDLDLAAREPTRPFVVHAALAASPGLARVASFGPPVGTGFSTGPTTADAQLGVPYPAVEVFEVSPAGEAVTTWPVRGTQRVTGGPESVLPLLESGALAPRAAAVLAADPDATRAPAGEQVLTDGYRDRELDVGRATDAASATLGAGTGRRLDRPVADYLPIPADGTRAVATVAGMSAVSASSSASDADALFVRGRDHNPAAAFDGDASTTWVTGGLVPSGQWVQARFPRARLVSVQLRAPLVAGAFVVPTRVRVTTDAGSVDVPLAAGTTTDVPLGVETGRLRVTITGVTGGRVGAAALEATVQTATGPLLAERGLRLAPGAGSTADGTALVLSAGRRDRPGCLLLTNRPVCATALPLGDEDDPAIDRTAVLDDAAAYRVAVRGRALAGPALDALLQQGQPVTATASSTAVPDPGDRPATVLDRDLATSWLASPFDPEPTLVLTFARPQRVTGVTLVVDPNLAASRPRAVTLRVDGGAPRTVTLDARSTARIPAVSAHRLTLTFPDVEVRTNRRLDGLVERLPVGVSEIGVDGPAGDLRQVLDPGAPLSLPCGAGPTLVVDGVATLRTRVSTSVGDVLAGRDVDVLPCGDGLVRLGAGEHRLRLARTPLVQVTGLDLVDVRRTATAPAPVRVERVLSWGPTRRAVEVAPGAPAYLVVHEAFNRGWTARVGGVRLPAVRLDGWQQGFVLPETGGRVDLVFTPDRPYRLSLLLGAVLAALLLGLSLVRGRGGPGAPGPRRRRRFGLVLAAAALPVLGGVAGLLAVVAVAVVHRLRPALLQQLGPAALVAAGAVVALDPWPSGTLLGAPVQALGLVALAALAVSLWSPPEPDVRRGPGS